MKIMSVQVILIECVIIAIQIFTSQCSTIGQNSHRLQKVVEYTSSSSITGSESRAISVEHERASFVITDAADSSDNGQNSNKEFPPSELYRADDDYDIAPASGDDELPECILSRSEFYLSWWVHENGTLKISPSYRLNGGGFIDLSLEIHSEEWIFEKVLSLRNANASEVIAFLSLANNRLLNIPRDTLLLVNSTLQYLSLANNNFDYLFIDNNDSDSFQSWTNFPILSNLRELDLRNCSITYLEHDIFDNLPSLEKLFLSYNKIMNISSSSFGHLEKLNHLDLSYNKQEIFTPYGIADPFELYLSGLMLEEDVFQNLTRLIFLDLSHTKLKQESLRALQWLPMRMEQLSLCYTDIPLITPRMFESTNLKVLDLSGNTGMISGLNKTWFGGLEDKLEILIFGRTNLKHISAFSDLRALRMLDLSNNNINQIIDRNFQLLQNLQIIDLSANHISNWYERVFARSKSLEIVNMRNNNINLITHQMMMDFNDIKFLSIGSNNFVCDCSLREFIDLAKFNARVHRCNGINRNRTRRSVDMMNEFSAPDHQYNVFLRQYHNYVMNYKESIANIIEDEEPAPESVSFVMSKISSNFSECDNLQLEGEWRSMNFTFILLDYSKNDYHCIESDEKQKIKILFSEITSCSYERATVPYEPTTNDGYTESIIEEGEYLPEMKPAGIDHSINTLAIIIFTSSLVAVLIMFLYYWKRKSIKYFFSVFKSSLILSLDEDDKKTLMLTNRQSRRKSKISGDNYVYDVFVSYCDKDRDWVLDHLIPNMEKRSEVTICLHERDFQVGLSILENIIQCMDQSRCLLLVISESFLKSNWCSFEMHLAQHRLIETRREQLILVLLQDIPRSRRPRTLNFLMRTKTYIMWPTGDDKETRNVFWKRLKKAIVFDGNNDIENKTRDIA